MQSTLCRAGANNLWPTSQCSVVGHRWPLGGMWRVVNLQTYEMLLSLLIRNSVLEKGPFWASALLSLKLISQSCTELVVEQMWMKAWCNKQLETQIQNHRFDYSLQSWGELQIWIQTSQLQPAIKQTYLYNVFNWNYIWISIISGKVWRHIWLEIFKHHLIFANNIFK